MPEKGTDDWESLRNRVMREFFQEACGELTAVGLMEVRGLGPGPGAVWGDGLEGGRDGGGEIEVGRRGLGLCDLGLGKWGVGA